MLVYIILLCACADGVRIVNGTRATPGQFPFLGSLRMYDRNESTQTCLNTACIISRNWIITAFATCLDDPHPTKQKTFFYGMVHFNYYEEHSKDYTQTVIHRVVSVNHTYPVLGETETPIDIRNHVQLGTILKHTPFGALKEGYGKVAGFGSDADDGGNRYVTYGVMKCNFYCRDVLDGAMVKNYSHVRYVCPEGEEFSPGLSGDAGAPLLLSKDGEHFYIGGVLYDWKKSHYPQQASIMVFVRTSEYLQWLRKYVPGIEFK